MDVQWILDVVLAGAGALGFFAIRSLVAKIEEHSRKLEDLRILVAGDYVKWADIEKIVAPVREQLMRIEDKLDGKADK